MDTQERLRHLLIRSRELIQQGWCQDDMAQDAEGRGRFLTEGATCRWCLLGALERAQWEDGRLDLRFSLNRIVSGAILPQQKTGLLSSYNDLSTTTQQGVLAVLDRAIAQVG